MNNVLLRRTVPLVFLNGISLNGINSFNTIEFGIAAECVLDLIKNSIRNCVEMTCADEFKFFFGNFNFIDHDACINFYFHLYSPFAVAEDYSSAFSLALASRFALSLAALAFFSACFAAFS